MPRRIPARLALPLIVLLTACSASRETAPRHEHGPVTVLVRNISNRTLTAVHVTTSENDQFSEEAIGPGQTAPAHSVNAIHSAVAVEALVDGHLAAVLPVEGFAGFNPPLDPGTYLVTIDVAAAGAGVNLIVSVTPTN